MKKFKPLQDETEAMRYAMRLLGRRSYTENSLLEKFRLRGLPGEMAQRVLQKLIAQKFISDNTYTESFVHLKMAQNWGPSKIRLGLYQKKVPRETIDRILKIAYTPEGEVNRALEVLERQKQRFLRKKKKRRPAIKTKLRVFGQKRVFSFSSPSRGRAGFRL